MKPLVSILLFVFSLQLLAQDNLIHTFATVEIKPSYPGGIQFFNQFVGENFQLPDNSEFKGGKMIVSFVIDTTGTVTDVNVLRDIGFGTADEAKRLLPTSEKWIPGKQDDRKVKVTYTMPITLAASEPVYDGKIIEAKPDYPGGIEEFYRFVGRTYLVPMVEGLKGKIFASFIIEKDGSINKARIIRDIGYGTGDELLRVLWLSKKWIPGKIDGSPVRVLYTLPVNIDSGN